MIKTIIKGSTIIAATLLSSQAIAAEDENYLVQCELNVSVESEVFNKNYPHAWAWLMKQREQGNIENVYFPFTPNASLTYVGKSSNGDTGIEKLINSDPLIANVDNQLIDCSYQKIGTLLYNPPA